MKPNIEDTVLETRNEQQRCGRRGRRRIFMDSDSKACVGGKGQQAPTKALLHLPSELLCHTPPRISALPPQAGGRALEAAPRAHKGKQGLSNRPRGHSSLPAKACVVGVLAMDGLQETPQPQGAQRAC